MPKLGAHESVGGGLHLAFARIKQVGGDVLQIFTRNQRQWTPAELKAEEVRLYREAHEESGKITVASHGSYLVNFATAKEELLQKSTRAFVLELQRCQQLGIPYVVLHPGSHGGDGAEAGLNRFVAGLDGAIEQSKTDVEVLVETTAGQGRGSAGVLRNWLISYKIPVIPVNWECVLTHAISLRLAMIYGLLNRITPLFKNSIIRSDCSG